MYGSVKTFFTSAAGQVTLLSAILLIAFLLRIYSLDTLPSGFHVDEASFLVNTKALLLAGRDEDSRFLPLVLKSLIDQKPALFSYLQIPFVQVFGWNYFAARLPSVLLGLVSIYLIYLLIKEVKGSMTALVVVLLFAISPWHIMLSRSSQEVILSFTFTILSIVSLLFVLKGNRINLIYSIVFITSAFISMYSYHSAKIFIPLIVLGVVIWKLYEKCITRRKAITISVLTICMTVGAISFFGFARVNAVAIFTDPHTQFVLDEKIRVATTHAPYVVIRLFDNKYIDYFFAIVKNYGQYFSTDFLLLAGGQPTRYIVPFHGQIYLIEAIFILIGIFVGIRSKERNAAIFFLYWLFIAPLPGALTTQEIPSIIRAFLMIVPLLYFASLGIVSFWSVGRRYVKYFIRTVIVIVYIASVSYFVFLFTIQQPHYHPWDRHFADDRLPVALSKMDKKYKKIYVATKPYLYFVLAGRY